MGARGGRREDEEGEEEEARTELEVPPAAEHDVPWGHPPLPEAGHPDLPEQAHAHRVRSAVRGGGD